MYWDPCIIGQSCTEIRALNGKIATTIQVQLGIGVRVQLQVGISRQAKEFGKILYICNRLCLIIVNSWEW